MKSLVVHMNDFMTITSANLKEGVCSLIQKDFERGEKKLKMNR